jgi:hypothetical protein
MTEDSTPDTDVAARQGIVVDDSDPDRLREALELALHYRGDVTVTCRNSGREIEGYLFDSVGGKAPGESAIRILLPDGDERALIRIDDISALTFSGRDTAQGKSFDTWMKKYVQKRLAGETASIESESLD